MSYSGNKKFSSGILLDGFPKSEMQLTADFTLGDLDFQCG